MYGKRSGFTLIELLVVIAIIAVLAAILFPVLAAAKNRARTIACLSNMKQLGYAMVLYTQDNGGRLPPYSRGGGASRLMWFDFIDHYLKEGKIYRCPALDWLNTTFVSGVNNRIYGYGVNYPHLFPPSGPSVKLDQVPRPSSTLMMCDAYTFQNPTSGVVGTAEYGFPVVYCRDTAHGWANSPPMEPDGNISGRHNGDTDVLYCDMHVHTWPKSYVDQPYSSAANSGNDDLFGHFDLP